MSETMDDFLAAVHDRLAPAEHHTAVRLADEARTKLATLATPTPAAPETVHPFTSGVLTDDWITAQIQRTADRELREKQRNVLTRFIADCDNQARATAADTNAILAAYHQKLVELLSEAANLIDQLAGANSAETAVDQNVGPQWKQLTALTRDYQQLRGAQTAHTPQDLVISARAANGTGEHPASDLYLRNLDDIWPHWRQPELTPNRTIRVTDGRRDHPEPWPTEPVPLLIWLVESDAEPWIPTNPQLRTLWQRRKNNGNPRPQQLGPRPPDIQVSYGVLRPIESTPTR